MSILLSSFRFVLPVFALSACVGTGMDLPKEHPANPTAASAPLDHSSSLLAAASQSPTPEEPMPANQQHDHHTGPAAAPSSTSGTGSQAAPSGSAEPSAKVIYTCPMHPQIIRNAPGKCPICGMNLVKKEPSHTHGAE